MTGKRGRPLGSKNKPRGLAALKAVREKFPDYDPLVHLAEIATDETQEMHLRMQASKEVVQYLYPKLKHTEVTGMDGAPIHQRLKVVFVGDD